MRQGPKRTVAALLITASLAAPGIAFAGAGSGTELSVPPAPPQAADSSQTGTAGTTVEAKITQQEAIAIARKYFTIPAELGEPNVGKSQYKESVSWRLDWQTPAKEAKRLNISVSVDAVTGAILSYSRYAVTPGETPPPLTYSRSEALKLAQPWLEKLVPDLKDAVRLQDNPLQNGYYGAMSTSYGFFWNRMEQGYPITGQGINITIDGRTGEMTGFSRQWGTAQTFTLPASVMEHSKVEAAYKEQLPMQLYYQRYQQPGSDTGEWKLVYRPVVGLLYMTQDGKLVDYTGTTPDPSRFAAPEPMKAPDQPYQAPAKPLTQDEALTLAREVAGRTDKPTGINYNEYGDEKKSKGWNFSWYKEGELKEGEYNTSVAIDADKGVVTSFNQWGRYDPPKADQQPKITEAEARAMAIDFMRKYRPDLVGSLAVQPAQQFPEGKRPPGYFMSSTSFVMLKNGIPVLGQTAQVEVDLLTGQIRNYWAGNGDTGKEPFPSPADVIKQVDAVSAILKVQPLELYWTTLNPNNGKEPVKGETPAQPAQPQLLWTPRQGLYVDAVDARSAAPLDSQGRDMIEAAKRPVDIDGHFAQKEIEMLWARGVFDLRDGKFNPKGTITVAELARWLVLARGLRPFVAYDFAGAFAAKGMASTPAAGELARSTEAPYLGAAMQAGILLPEDFAEGIDLNTPVTREVLALWAVRAMGYGAIAKIANKIEMPFADKDQVGARYANSVAILNGLGVLKGDGNNQVNPQRRLTRGEAAKVLFAVATQTTQGPVYYGK